MNGTGERKRRGAVSALGTVIVAMVLSGCGTPTGMMMSGGEFGDTHAGNAKRPQPHQGTDFMVPRGTPVIAAADGVVSVAIHHVDPKELRKRFNSGPRVQIDHHERGGGSYTRYHHLGNVLVNFGDTVRAGEVIGDVGICSTGPPRCGYHLHFETVDNYIRKNPRHVIAGCFSKGEEILSEERWVYHPLEC